jgi:hypothetical protein
MTKNGGRTPRTQPSAYIPFMIRIAVSLVAYQAIGLTTLRLRRSRVNAVWVKRGNPQAGARGRWGES